MDRIPLSEADGHMAELVERASRGEEIIFTKDGAPIARLAPLPETSALQKHPIRFGLLKGRITVAEDFDDPLPEDLLKSFYGLAPDEAWPEEMKDAPG